ncbi:hypothetical protein [Amycolatopsis sp. lyj-346]|uniref:hypothetical protein n=1 Tax=Amycolatopsis sp. lyj-346 TaxID=2789289 RepID=UPI00397A9AFF
MVIKRRDTTAGQPVRRHLGHVSVNTDDLQALIDLLRSRPEVDDEVLVEFDEGDFTEGKDLRALSQGSLRDLRVKAGDLIVHLGERRAEAIGPGELVDFVFNAWARSRQTSRYPESFRSGDKFYPRLSMAISALMAVGLLIYVAISLPVMDGLHATLVGAVIVVLFGFEGWLGYFSSKKAFHGTAWAVIRPYSAHEIREMDSKKTVVPLWSLIVAILAFAVSSTFLILNYLK